jgi:hypothetical protein
LRAGADSAPLCNPGVRSGRAATSTP